MPRDSLVKRRGEYWRGWRPSICSSPLKHHGVVTKTQMPTTGATGGWRGRNGRALHVAKRKEINQ